MRRQEKSIREEARTAERKKQGQRRGDRSIREKSGTAESKTKDAEEETRA
jgi:hypothetical protein